MLTFISHSLQETQTIAKKLAQETYNGVNIFLFAEIGAGKTHFIQAFLEEKGVKNLVTSPTFSILKTYCTEKNTFVHTDLYRLQKHDIILAELEESFLNQNTNVLVEWAEQLTDFPSPRIEVRIQKTSEFTRKIFINFIGFSLPQKKLEELIAYYQIPQHIYKHSLCVCRVAETIVDYLILNKQAVLDREMVRQSALLHDLVRYIDFQGGLQRKFFSYKVSEDTWTFWNTMRKKYPNRHHADIAADILFKMGLFWLGNIILSHKSSAIFTGFNNTYEKIMHYADKRCKHDQIVPLLDRLSDLEKRYGQNHQKSDYWYKIREKNIQLETELDGQLFNFEEK